MSNVFRVFVSLVTIVVGLRSAAAQGPAVQHPIDLYDLGSPSFTTFSTRDGVPESVTSGIQTDRDGFVWASGSQGLARYDGNRWNGVDAPAIKGVLGALSVDHEGTLWVAFRDRGVAHFDGTSWIFETTVPTGHVRRVAETVDAAGHFELWAATFGSGLQRKDHERWVPAPRNDQLPDKVISVARTHTLFGHERLWSGTLNEGLMYREDGDWKQYRGAGFDKFQIEDLLATTHDGKEELWISTFGAGLWRLDDNGLQVWNVASGEVSSDDFYELAESTLPDGDRAIWAASRSGLVRVHNERARVFDRQYGLPSDVVRGLKVWHAPDGVDVLWLATENGIARTIAGAGQWHIASLIGARASGVFGVLVEPDGNGGERVWAASTGDGLGLYENHHWRIYTAANGGLPSDNLRLIKRAPEADGVAMLWAGFAEGHLARMNANGKFETIAVPWEIRAGQTVTDVLGRKVDGRFEQWFATRTAGLYRRRDGVWTAFHPEGTSAPWRATGMVEQIDPSGHSWLWASSEGLLRFDGEHVALLGRDVGLPDGNLIGISLLPDAQGRPILWIGSDDHGIVRVEVSDPLHPNVLHDDLPAPPDPTAYGALRDAQGRVYICTNNGVQMLTPQAGGYESRVFTRRDGMVHDECNTQAQFLDAHGRFWTGTLGGLTVFDPDRERSDHQRKPLKVTQVRVDDALVDPSRITIEPGQHDLTVQYALLSWQGEDRSEFRTQLAGYESYPVAWTHQNSRTFGALPPGSYSLHVEARDYAGNISIPLEVSITVLPAWWQTAWARVILILAAGLFLYAILQWRIRALKAQQHHLEHKVDARTAELNEANARLLELSYHDALTGLANRRRLLDTLEAEPTRGDDAPTGLIFVDVDHFKAYNDDYGHPAGDEALRSVAAAMRACVPPNALVARYGGEEFACLLPATGIDQIREFAQKIRAAVAERDVPVPGTQKVNRVTISAGVAVRNIAFVADAHLLLRDADIALYQAKREGRNCVRG